MSPTFKLIFSAKSLTVMVSLKLILGKLGTETGGAAFTTGGGAGGGNCSTMGSTAGAANSSGTIASGTTGFTNVGGGSTSTGLDFVLTVFAGDLRSD